MSKIIIEKVKEIIMPYLKEENIILFDIEYVFEDNENILRIYIDNEEENIYNWFYICRNTFIS